ncbi:MAG: nitroreductase family protein [Actinobacteria bacterium]|nr:nitroreductase family protein [Actinomycetota bacterium]NCU80602.1 nitroreductase family protein [Acidimicrobiia bacterium]NDC99145.1 nitroreductase family protein [bacterium]NBQ44824.1 nitroreductase family protein [Actinomycetota bacterium]NBY61289.1 nitroreductase family protein [Actinomycetota bacterium]
MQFADCVRTRRMVRAFRRDPIQPELVERVVDLASRAPSAGKTQGWHFLVLRDHQTKKFWEITLPEEKRSSFRWSRLLDAPLIGLVFANPSAYLERYSEPDKANTKLGDDVALWPTPYWTVDASFATMQLLLAAHDVGLGALFFGVFNGETQLRAEYKVPERFQLIGAVAMGWPMPETSADRGASAARARRKPIEIIHEGSF